MSSIVMCNEKWAEEIELLDSSTTLYVRTMAIHCLLTFSTMQGTTTVALHERSDMVDSTISLLQSEWPRSVVARYEPIIERHHAQTTSAIQVLR